MLREHHQHSDVLEAEPADGRPPETACPAFLSVAMAAETLSVSDDTIYEILNRGELPCLRLGRRRVIPRRAVELVIERLLADFDPDRLAARLATSSD